MPLPTNNKGAECGSPCSSKGIPILTLRGRFSLSHRAHPQPRRGVTAVGDSRGAPHRGWERRRDGARRGTALQAAPSLYLRGTPSERPRRGSRTPRIAAGARGSPATRPAALTCLRDNAEPQPEGQRANSLHLRGCGRFGTVRSGAERPAPELCSRRSPAAATRGGGRGGSTGTASFSSGRPPPSAEPRGASGGYGAGRGGTGRAAGRRGGLHLRLRAEAGDGGCRHLHELTSHPLQRIAPRVSPSHGGAHLARGRARLLSPCLSVRSLEAHTCARAVLHPPRTHLCAHTHSCSFRDYGPPSCRPSTRTGSSCAALSTHTHP